MLGRSMLLVLGALTLSGCSRKIPSEVKPVLEAQRAAALKAATDAAAACPPLKPGAPFNPSPIDAKVPAVANPAKGTSLESEKDVQDVFVMCEWPDPRDAKGSTWGGSGLPALRGTSSVRDKPVTMPDDFAENTCQKNESSCEQVVVPSRYSKSPTSADLRIVRPSPDGGRAEVTVVFVHK